MNKFGNSDLLGYENNIIISKYYFCITEKTSYFILYIFFLFIKFLVIKFLFVYFLFVNFYLFLFMLLFKINIK